METSQAKAAVRAFQAEEGVYRGSKSWEGTREPWHCRRTGLPGGWVGRCRDIFLPTRVSEFACGPRVRAEEGAEECEEA